MLQMKAIYTVIAIWRNAELINEKVLKTLSTKHKANCDTDYNRRRIRKWEKNRI